MLQNVTGVFPTFPARSYCYVADGDEGCGNQDGSAKWHNSTVVEGVMWKGDTSSDEMNGHYAALPIFYDLVAETAECLEAAERIARFVRAHPNKV